MYNMGCRFFRRDTFLFSANSGLYVYSNEVGYQAIYMQARRFHYAFCPSAKSFPKSGKVILHSLNTEIVLVALPSNFLTAKFVKYDETRERGLRVVIGIIHSLIS